MSDPIDHRHEAIQHLDYASTSEPGSPQEHFHLSSAATHATLANAEAASRQVDVMARAAQINARLLELMTAAEPAPVAHTTTEED